MSGPADHAVSQIVIAQCQEHMYNTRIHKSEVFGWINVK